MSTVSRLFRIQLSGLLPVRPSTHHSGKPTLAFHSAEFQASNQFIKSTSSPALFSLTESPYNYGQSQSIHEWSIHFEELPISHQCSPSIWRRCVFTHIRAMGCLLSHGSISECFSGFGQQRECAKGTKHWRCVYATLERARANVSQRGNSLI